MDEQRAWIKSRRKRRLRILAAALAFCLLFTTYPDILATLSVWAAGTQDGDGTVYVSGFEELPEEVREQTVPLGTGIEELTLPDTLEVFVTITEEEDAAEEEAPDKKENPDDSGSKEEGTVSGAGTETGTDETGGETDGGTGTDENNNGDETETGGDTDNNGDNADNGDNTDNNGGETDNGGETENGDSNGNNGDASTETGGDTENNGDTETGGETDNNGDSTDSNGGGQNTEETQTEDTDQTEDTGNTDNTEAQQEQPAPEESAPEGQALEETTLQESTGTDVGAAEPAAFSQETYTVTLPVYAAGNELDIETLEASPAGEAGSADTGAADNADDNADSTDEAPADSRPEQTVHTEQAALTEVAWESAPSYDGNTEGVYVFTAVLPEGYALSEGVSLPEITVTVRESEQAKALDALLVLLRALPDPEGYLAYDEGADVVTEHEEIIDEEQLAGAREAADAYLEAYPDTAINEASDEDTEDDTDTATLASLLARLEGLEHIRDTETDCMETDCPYHYPQFVKARMEEDEIPELLTLEDLVEDYGVEEPAPARTPAQSLARLSRAGYAAAPRAATPSLHPQTLMVTADNENNAHTGTADGDIDDYMSRKDGKHPIELTFTLNELPAQSAYLAVKAYDVDEDYGEHDYVYLNEDIYQPMNLTDSDRKTYNSSTIGYLAGTNDTWNTSVLEIPLEKLVKGKNVISVTVAEGWCVGIDWMQLILDGGAADANITEFSLKLKDSAAAGGNVTVNADVIIRQGGTTEYITEYTLTQNATGNALDACFGKAKASEQVSLALPLTSPSGTYTITGMIKDPADETIKAVDKLSFWFTKGVGLGPAVSHTLTPDTLTNQNVTIRVSAKDMTEAKITDVAVSSPTRTVMANGTYNFTVTYKQGGASKSLTYSVQVDNIDKTPPVITYTPITVPEETPQAEVEALFKEALSASDDRKLADNPLTYTLLANISYLPGTKNVTVTAADAAGNTVTKTCAVTVTAKPLQLTMGTPTAVSGSRDSFALKAVLTHTGTDTITKTGFVWGVMPNPTLEVKNGTAATASPVKTKGAAISGTATGIAFGVQYYARAYATLQNGSTVYSESVPFGSGLPAYGTFSVSKVSGSTFTITRTGGTDGKQTVYYRTVNGSAIGGTHFTHAAGGLVFADGATSKTVTVSEKGVTTAYGGRAATSYSNADRTYSLEIYRVDGGGQLDTNKANRSKTRTMTKNSGYTINRSVYTTDKSVVNVGQTSGTNGRKIADTTSKQGGKTTNVSFLTNRYGNKNYNTSTDFADYYTDAKERTYLRNTAAGWYYRYDLLAYEYEDGYEHAYIGKQPLSDTHYKISSAAAAVSGQTGQLWACNFQQGQKDSAKHYYFPDSRTGGGENWGYPLNSSGNYYSYSGKTYVRLGFDETCYVYFGATGSGSDIWYVDGLTSYACVYDEQEPKWIGVAPMAGGTYLPGDPITVALVFDEIVDKTNSPSIKDVSLNTNVGRLTYAGGADTNVLYFTGTVDTGTSLNGSSALKVESINNSSDIKDMCELAGTATPSSGGNTNVTVDASKPDVTIAPQTSGSLPQHKAKITSSESTVQYAWTKDAGLPAAGWQTTNSGVTLTESRGSAGKSETWYLHVLATASSGASTHTYKAFTFLQPDITKVSVREGTAASSADVSGVWKKEKYILAEYAGAQTNGTKITLDGPQTGTQNITAGPSGTAAFKVTENGAYTLTLTDSYHNVITKAIEVKMIDAVSPTASLRSGSQTGNGVTHNSVTAVITPSDKGGSGVAKVEYAWTNTEAAPSAWTVLNKAADGSYQTTYTATETAKTNKYLHVKVTDGAGNVSSIVRSGPYSVIAKAAGNALPMITVTVDDSTWTKSKPLTWEAKAGTGTGAGAIKSVNVPTQDVPVMGQTTGTCTVTKNGNYLFAVTDENGNTVTQTVTVTKIDNEAPKIANITAKGGQSGTVTLTGVTDALTRVLDENGNFKEMGGSGVKTVQYRRSGDTDWTDASGTGETVTISVTKNGVYQVQLTDNAGNTSETYSVEVSGVDATKPTAGCTILSGKDASGSGWYTENPFRVKLTYADGTGGSEGGTPSGIASVEYKWVTGSKTTPATGLTKLNAAAVTAGEYTLNLGYYDNAEAYYLYYKVTDKTGNVTEGFSGEIKKDSYKGSGTVTGPSEGQSEADGLAMQLTSLTYGPSGGKVTGGPADNETDLVTLQGHESGQITLGSNPGYTAKDTGEHYFRIYPAARNNGSTQSSYYWAFYVRKVTFDCQGGPEVPAQLVWHDSTSDVKCKVAVPTEAVRTGYTFGGWYTDAACTEKFNFDTQLRTDTTLYAKWTANEYKVTYHLANPDGTETTDFGEYTYGEGLTLPAPEWTKKTGFAFDGWYAEFENGNYEGPAYTAIGETATGDKTYYGRFKDVEAPTAGAAGVTNGTKSNGWYRGNAAGFYIKYGDNNGAKDVTASILVDSVEKTDGITKGVGGNGIGRCDYPLVEGEHTYQWKLVDKAGNVVLGEKTTYKYDNTRPTTGTITYDGVAGAVKVTDSDNRPVYYLCGNKEVTLFVPVEDTLSGVDMLRYREREKGAAGDGEGKELQLSGENEETVKLTFGPGTAKEMRKINCFDKAGSALMDYVSFASPFSSGVIGTDAAWIGIIVEDTKPNITIMETDASNKNPKTLSTGWYESPPSRFQVTMNDTGATGAEMGAALSSGIKHYAIYINGDEKYKDSFNNEIKQTWNHSFPLDADAKGVVNITVEVADYAGNVTTQSVNVKIKGTEQTPAAKADYPNDALSGLAPNAEYQITVPVSGGGSSDYTVTSDGNGRIPFVLDGKGEESEGRDADICGKTISIVKLGVTENGQKCSDNSAAQTLTIEGRPLAIAVGDIDVTPEMAQDAENAIINLTIAGDTTGAKEYRYQTAEGSPASDSTWKDVPTDTGKVENLKPGNIFVRVKATETAPHGRRSGAKEIEAGSATINAVFNLNYAGASGGPQMQTGKKGSDVLTEPDVPTREGYDFMGWYMEPACKNEWRFTATDGAEAYKVRDWRKSETSTTFDPDTVDSILTITLYAGWRENVKPTLTPKLTTTPAGGSQTDVTNQDGWYPNLSLSLDYSDNVEVTKLSVSVDGGTDQDLSLSGTANGADTNGYMKYTISNVIDIREGNHTYVFTALDAAGNFTETSVTARLDTGKPSLGAADFEVGHRSFWDWIVGKKTLKIIIPVTETLSGIDNDGVKYVLTPDGGSAQAAQKAAVSGSTENGYTATISIATDFKGKIEITATDNAGNVSDTQTIGADGSGINGVIVESNAPEITILADREPTDFSSTKTETEAESETDKITNNTNIDTSAGAAYYNSAPRLYVKVTDADSAGKTTSGLKSVTWKIEGVDGGAEHDAGLNFGADILTEHSFTISAMEGVTGEVQVTVTATDQAGNETTRTVPVRIKAREEKPEPVIDYINEKLKNLVPNGAYKLLDTDGAEKEIKADADGCIKIEEEWFGREVQLCKTGNGSTTLDSVKTDVKPAARPAPPKVEVQQNETKQGKADGIIGRTDSALDLATLEYSTDGGENWTAVTDETDVTALKPFKLSEDKETLENCAAGPCLFRVRAANDAPNAAPCGEQMEVIVGAGTPLTLSFEEKGGSEIEDITGLSWLEIIKKPKDPVRAGYALEGWYTDDACSEGKQWQFASGQTPDETADKIEEDTTLYAKWADAAAPALSAVLVNPVNNGNADGGQWYGRLSIALTYSDNEGVNNLSLYVGVDVDDTVAVTDSRYKKLSLDGAVQAGKGADGSIQYLLYDNDLTEGAHTYTFKAVDAAGNTATAELTARLDTTAPEIGRASYEKDPANLWDWIIGKDSLIITLPLTEKGSGVEAVDYVLTPDGDSTGGTVTGTAKIRKLSGSDTDADFTAEITVPADFKGKVKVTARDFVGNSSEKTLGVEQDSNDKNGIIVEDNAPDIHFAIEGGEVAETYYETAPQVDIAVDDTGWAGEPDGAGQTKAVSLTTGGIASVVCTITSGSETRTYTPATDYTTAMKTSDSFAIPAEKLSAGINTITVTATDHAGNKGEKKITVKVKTPEGTPNATIGYVAETLNNLVPNAEYRIDGLGMRADAKGSVPIDENWIGTEITVVQMGSAESMTESAPQKVALPARPEAPAVTVENETYPNAGDGRLIMTEADKTYQYSADGLNWSDAETGADMEITGLAAKDYYVRAKAIENTSFRSKEGTVTVGTTPPEPYDPPQTEIDYENEMLSKLEPEAEYIIEYGGDPNDPDDEVVTVIITADKDGKIPVKPEWQGEELSIVQKSNGKEKSDSPEQLLDIPVRPEAPNPSGEDETGIRTGAKLTNLTAGKTYDISRDDGKNWLQKTADANGVISGVDVYAPAAYIVRVAAVGGFKSPNSGKVIVDGYHIPVTYMADGSAYDTSWAYYGKAPQNIPAVPPKADAGDKTYVGEWCADVSGTPADLKNITDVTTVYAYYTIGYNVILKGIPGCTLAAAPGSASPVKEGADFTLQFTLSSGYEKTDGFAVKVDGVKIELEEDGTYTIENITEDHTVTVEGIRKKPSSGGPDKSDHDSDGQTGGDNNPPAGDNPADGSTTPGGTTPGGTKPGTENPDGTTPDGTNPDGTNPDGKKPGQTDADEQKPGGTDADDKNPGGTDTDQKKPGETDTDQTKPGGKFPHKEVPDGKTPGGSGFPDGVKLPDGTKLTAIIVPVTIEDGKLVLLPGTPDGGGDGIGDGTGTDGTGDGSTADGSTADGSAGDGSGTDNAAAVPAGNVPGMEAEGVILQAADGGGTVIVTVICEDKEYTAGVADTIAVANAVLTPEQIELVGGGETIEILIDVKDITDSVPLRDKEIIENGIEAGRKDHPGLTLGMYIDISMFVKVGKGDWNTITHTEEPVDVVIGIPETLKAEGREFTIIRSHDGEYTLLPDLDDNPDTITISTDLFSAYAIAYEQADQTDGKCGLCHICPTFLGICYFIWLAVIVAAVLLIWILVRSRKKEEKEQEAVK